MTDAYNFGEKATTAMTRVLFYFMHMTCVSKSGRVGGAAHVFSCLRVAMTASLPCDTKHQGRKVVKGAREETDGMTREVKKVRREGSNSSNAKKAPPPPPFVAVKE